MRTKTHLIKTLRWPPLILCPWCGAAFPNNRFVGGSVLVCPTCAHPFEPAHWYSYLQGWGALAISVVLSMVLGLRGLWLPFVAALLWFPVLVVWMFLLGAIVPPRFSRYIVSAPLIASSLGLDSTTEKEKEPQK